MSLSNVFHNIAGTLKSAFRIGRNGPSLCQGTLGPNVGLLSSLDGDIYIQHGSVNKFFQKRDGIWVDISAPAFSRTAVTTSSHTAQASEHYFGVNYNGPVVITLPLGVEGKQYIVKDESGLVDPSRIITIQPSGSDTIDNKPNTTIQSGFVSLTFVYGSEWHLI